MTNPLLAVTEPIKLLANPTGTVWALGAATAALVLGGVTAIIVTSKKKKKKKTQPPGPTGPTQPPGGGGGGGGGGPTGPTPCYGAVGDPAFTDWPYKSRWGNPRAFGIQLRNFGYSPGQVEAADWQIFSDQARSAIKKFQADYNKVRLTIAQPPPKLSVDGCIGPETARAFKRAEDWALLGNMTWKQLVAAS